MLRTTALLRGLIKAPSIQRGYRIAIPARKPRVAYEIHPLRTERRYKGILYPSTTPVFWFATKAWRPHGKIGQESERRNSEKKLKVDPDTGDKDAHHDIKSELEAVKETFALIEVPRESYFFGVAGVLPYLATSLSTVWLAYDINRAHLTGSGLLFSPETARQLLSIIEPIQIGYGAVIISFLGAIHWGLEYAGYSGRQSYRRYAFGVVAPAVAWPTMLMPTEYALISQFIIFNLLYFADAQATVRGWAPPWYAMYRFVLTLIVGASIVVSLIGRGRIVPKERSAGDVTANGRRRWARPRAAEASRGHEQSTEHGNKGGSPGIDEGDHDITAGARAAMP